MADMAGIRTAYFPNKIGSNAAWASLIGRVVWCYCVKICMNLQFILQRAVDANIFSAVHVPCIKPHDVAVSLKDSNSVMYQCLLTF